MTHHSFYYYRGIYSAKHLQILQNVQFQIQIQCFHNFRKCPDICTESGFYKVHDECFLWQHWIQIPKQKQNLQRQPELPSLPARFCKIWNANFLKIFTFSQEFLLSWDKDLDFLLAGHWEYMFLLLLEFFLHVILITWGLESGLAKFFFAESVPLWYSKWGCLPIPYLLVTRGLTLIFPDEIMDMAAG